MEIPQDKIQEIEGKKYYHYSLFKHWDKNEQVRTISESNWLKLLADYKRNGRRDPLKVDTEFIVYDGNHGLKAITQLISEGILSAENGKSLEWLEADIRNPQTEAQKWEIALTGNEGFASWNRETLPNFTSEFENELDLSLINIDFMEPLNFEEQIDLSAKQDFSDKNKEIDAGELAKNLNMKCPKCGFEFKGNEGLGNEQPQI